MCAEVLSEEQKAFIDILGKALKSLYSEKDNYLLEKGCSERAIAFRLGYHIQNEFKESPCFGRDEYKDYTVDAEYSLCNGTPVKEVYKNCAFCDTKDRCHIDIPKGSIEKWIALFKAFDELEDCKGRRPYMYPDLIVHKRGSDVPNLAAIEIKCTWNHDPMGRPNDKAKLSYMTCPKSEYKYHMGFSLDLDKNFCTANLFYPKDGIFFNSNESITLFENSTTTVTSVIPSPNPSQPA